MSATYYPCVARVESSNVFFLWFTNDIDGVHLEDGDLLTFDSISDCLGFAMSRNFSMGDREPTLFEIDPIWQWLQTFDCGTVDPLMLLNIWNLIEDFLRSRAPNNDPFPLAKCGVYDKLFWASNLPAVTPPGQRFDPEWSTDERREIATILTEPFSEFRGALLR